MTETQKTSADLVTGGLTPYLMVDGAMKAADFYSRAFGAETVFSYPPDEQGRTMHIHMHVNGSSLMLGDAYPEHGVPLEKPQAFNISLHYGAGDIEGAWQRAVDAGCSVIMPLAEMFWGDNYGQLRDPFGVTWAMDAPILKG